MNLEKNYQLLDVVSDDGIRTLGAKEIASGRALQVHLFMKQEDHALFESLHGLPLSGRRQLLEFGSELMIPYLVTDPIPAETNARAWFTTLLTPMPSAPEPKPQPIIKASVWKTGTPLPDPLFPQDADLGPGDFTRMFQAPAAPAAAPPEPVKPAPEPKQTAPEPGEFTRMFQAPSAAPEPVKAPKPGEFTRMFQAPPTPAAPAQPPTPANVEPGEITRTMALPVAPKVAPPAPAASAADEATRLFKAPEPAPPPPAAKEPGEFTKLFQSMQPAPGAPPEPAKPEGPGEFTRMFQSPLSPGVQNKNAADPFTAPPPPPPPPNRAGEFTQLFGTPSGGPPATPAPPLGGGFGGGQPGATGAFASPAAQTPRQYQKLAAQGPGQFTQMMAASSGPTLGQTPPAQPSAPVKAKNSNLPLFIILGALAVFAILIVVFFAMRK